MRRVPRSDRLAAIFMLGVLAFSPALLSIFRVDRLVFGLPGFYLYLFLAWLVLILLGALASEGLRPSRRRGRARDVERGP